MKIKTVLIIVILLAFAVSVAANRAYLDESYFGLKVIVENHSAQDFKNIRVALSNDGDDRIITALKPSTNCAVWPMAKGENSLNVYYEDSVGGRHKAEIDVYIEPSFMGTIRVSLAPGDRVTWTSTGPLPFLAHRPLQIYQAKVTAN